MTVGAQPAYTGPMTGMLSPVLKRWPLAAAIVSAAMLAIAHAFQTFGHLAPCELCLKQRTVYWVALALGLIGAAAAPLLRKPWIPALACALLALVFLFGAGLAAYHAGVEWKWWPGPTTCTGAGGARAGTAALLELLHGGKIRAPQCDVAAWRMLGLSMAGWNALASLGFAAISALAAARRPEPSA